MAMEAGALRVLTQCHMDHYGEVLPDNQLAGTYVCWMGIMQCITLLLAD